MRHSRVVVGLIAVTVVSTAAVLTWPRGPRPCRATFEQVREGMTYEEVIATVGAPPGDYSGGRCIDGWIGGGSGSMGTYWTTTERVLFVLFDSDGRAAAVRTWEPTLLPDPPLWTRLRFRLGL
jgi:hypothetical protein